MTNKPLTDSERIERYMQSELYDRIAAAESCFYTHGGGDYYGETIPEMMKRNFDEIRKESYEQGFNDACEKWENVLKHFERDVTPYSSHRTLCCKAVEQEGEDGVRYCPKCDKTFPEYYNEAYNEAIDDILSLAEKEGLVSPNK